MDVVDVRPLGVAEFQSTRTTTLVKTDQLELIRLVLPKGKNIAEHEVEGEITVQCLEGRVEFRSNDITRVLSAGQLVYLAGGSKHSLIALDDASLLITILLNH
jgi:quercetin dioxygenase-like cupin family protein